MEFNASAIISNLEKGMGLDASGHMQGFPDSVRSQPLRGVYALTFHEMWETRTDPEYKAAAILLLICVAGEIITVTPQGYRCNDGFIDSFGAWNRTDSPVADNLRILRDRYIRDEYYLTKAMLYFGRRRDGQQIRNAADLQSCEELIAGLHSLGVLERKNTEAYDTYDHLMYLLRLMEVLSCPLTSCAAQMEPAVWDAEKWHNMFQPIWDSRNRFLQHRYRAEYYQSHLEVVQRGRYISRSGRTVEIPWDAYEMMRHSKMYSAEMQLPPPEKTLDTEIGVWQWDCLDAAKELQRMDSGKTAVLNLANRQNPGGGVYSGSGAQEESCFLRSDYFLTLYPFAAYAPQYGLPKAEKQYPMDRNFGGVWSEGVTVFRGKESEGYPLLDEPWQTNFIAVAGLNRPPLVLEDGEERLTPEMAQATLNKIRTILGIAADNHVTQLVLGALGCGAFRNPPRHVAQLFRQALEEPAFRGRFQKVVFAIINRELCEVFAGVFGCPVRDLQ